MIRLFSRYLPLVASVAIGILPIAVLILYFDVPRKLILGWGVLSYVIGVTAFKLPLYHFLVVKVLHPRLARRPLSAAQGFVSALSELGSAAWFMVVVVPDMTLAQLVGFGVAAAGVEAVVLPFMGNPFAGTPLEEHSRHIFDRPTNRRALEWMGVLERALVFMPHVSSRGLIYVSIASGSPYPAMIGIVLFAAIDGVGYFGHLSKWDFGEVHILTRFYAFLAIIGIGYSSDPTLAPKRLYPTPR
jgi:hypothetical protein